MTMTPGGDQLEILKQLADIRDMVEDVKRSITGDLSLGHRGLAERMERVEIAQADEADQRRKSVERVHSRIDGLEKKWAYVVGAVIGSGAFGGGVGAVIVKFWT